MDDSAANDMSDDAPESEVAAASSDSADVRSLATTSSAGSSASHVSVASLSSASSLLRLLSIMPTHELQAAGVIASAAAALPPASPSKSTHPASVSSASASSSPVLQSSPAASGLRELGDECVWQLSSCKAGNGVSQLRDGALETFWQSDGSSPHSITLHFARKTRIAALCFYVDYKLDESYTPSRMTVRAGANAASMTDIASIELTEPTGWVTLYTLTPRQTTQQQQRQHDADGGAAATASKQQPASASVSHAISPASFFSPSHPALHLPFARPAAAAATSASAASSSPPLSYVPIRCHYLQLLIVSSHQSGKDTHIREVRVYGPAAGVRDSSRRRAGGATAATAAGAAPGGAQLAKHSSVALFHPVFSSIEFQSTRCIR